MASEGKEKPEVVGIKQENIIRVRKGKHDQIVLVLRVVAFLATAAATIVMGLNKETKTLVVGAIGSNPITATLQAKFQQTPAFLYVYSFIHSFISIYVPMHACPHY